MRVGQQWSENIFEELNHLYLHLTLEHIGKNLATYFFQFNFKYKIFKKLFFRGGQTYPVLFWNSSVWFGNNIFQISQFQTKWNTRAEFQIDRFQLCYFKTSVS
jgi:hypothetical protein